MVLRGAESHFLAVVNDAVLLAGTFANVVLIAINLNEAFRGQTCVLDVLCPNPNSD